MEVTNQVNADGAAAEGVASKEHVGGEVNPSIDDEDSIPKDQYGDWLVVNKGKRHQKLRDRIPNDRRGNNSSGNEGKNLNFVGNKFNALGTQDISAHEIGYSKENTVGPSNTGKEPRAAKNWTRKKGSRREPVHMDKVIITKDGPQLLSTMPPPQRMDQRSQQPVIGNPNGNNASAGRIENVATEGPTAEVTHAHGISTTMPVQILAPNRLRFVDPPKPPDPKDNDVGDMDMESEDPHQENDDIKSEEEVIMVEETPN